MRKNKISDSAVAAILVFSLDYKICFVGTFKGKIFTGMRSEPFRLKKKKLDKSIITRVTFEKNGALITRERSHRLIMLISLNSNLQ